MGGGDGDVVVDVVRIALLLVADAPLRRWRRLLVVVAVGDVDVDGDVVDAVDVVVVGVPIGVRADSSLFLRRANIFCAFFVFCERESAKNTSVQ